MREIRLALLEADVKFKAVKDFVAWVRERAMGQDVLRSLTPGQQVVKIVSGRQRVAATDHHDEPLPVHGAVPPGSRERERRDSNPRTTPHRDSALVESWAAAQRSGRAMATTRGLLDNAEAILGRWATVSVRSDGGAA